MPVVDRGQVTWVVRQQETYNMPGLDSIMLDLSGWQSIRRDEAMAVWSDSDGDALGINVFNAVPDIPPPGNGVGPLRDYFRSQCTPPDSGIVEVDVVFIQGIPCGRLIVKSRMQPTGFTFQGTCVIAKQDFSFVIRVQCLEHGATGLREAAIMMIEMSDPEYDPDPNQQPHPLFPNAITVGRIKGWFKDPYDSAFDAQALRTLADDARYDSQFPDHPLSRARRKIDSVIQSVRFGHEVLEATNHA